MTAPLLLRQRVAQVAEAVRDLLSAARYRVDVVERDDGRGAVVLLVRFTDVPAEDPVRVRIGEPQ